MTKKLLVLMALLFAHSASAQNVAVYNNWAPPSHHLDVTHSDTDICPQLQPDRLAILELFQSGYCAPTDSPSPYHWKTRITVATIFSIAFTEAIRYSFSSTKNMPTPYSWTLLRLLSFFTGLHFTNEPPLVYPPHA